VPAIIRPDPKPQQFLSLRQSPAAQLLDRKGGQGDCSRLAALGFLFPDGACISLFGAGDDCDLA
jgi:hypothetical protein